MSRLAAELTRVKPISFTDQLPLIFRGKSQIPNIGAQQRRQARRRRSPGQADQGDVRAKRSRLLGVRGLHGFATMSTSSVSDEMTGGQSRRGVAARLRALGAAHRPADARAVQPGLRRRRRLGHPCQPGRAPPAIWPTASANSAAALAGFSEEIGPAGGATPWWS